MAKSITVVNLRCEYHTNPAGIDEALPRLSWQIHSEKRGQVQRAYRIIVSSTADNLRKDIGDLWDTGKLDGDQSAHIEYGGTPLTSRMQCHWKVRVWGRGEESSTWSEDAVWTMGLLEQTDWQANWIGYDAPVRKPARTRKSELFLPPARYLRKEFKLKKRKVRRATAYATALGVYVLQINDQQVGQEFLTPGWTDYDKRVHYQTYDISALLKEGTNAIGAVLGDGWYAGYLGPDLQREHYGKSPRLRVQIEIEYEDESVDSIVSNGTWKATTGPLLESDMLMGETYDATQEMPGWCKPDFDNTGWKKAVVDDAIDTICQAYPGTPTRRVASIKPEEVTEPTPGVYVFNMGQNFAGYARLRVTEAAGTRITMRFAERLAADGTIYTDNLRSARASDTYICKGGEEERWRPTFAFHGFQYVEVTGLTSPPGNKTITGIAISSDTNMDGHFECSDKLINSLYSNIVWTQRSNFIEVPTDCPQRDERLGWTGDAQAYIRTAAWNADISAFFTKWLTDLSDAQLPDGSFPDVAPRKIALGAGNPAWAEAGIICPWTLYRVYGDERILSRHYESMKRFMAYCCENSKNFIRPAVGYGDWLSVGDETPKEVLATAYFAYSAKLMSRIAKVLGDDKGMAQYNQLAENIRKAFCKAFVSKDGQVRGNTQTGYALALGFNLLDEKVVKLAAENFVASIQNAGMHLQTGFVGTKFLLPVLTKIGRTDIAYELLHQDTYPSWLFSVKNGATSIWERWNGWTPEEGFFDPSMNSFAHYSFGSVAEWMFKTIGGIDTDGAGFRRVTFRPKPGGKLYSATVTYNSMRGEIAMDWKMRSGKFFATVTVPANVKARLFLPSDSEKGITESGKKPAAASGVLMMDYKNKRAEFKLGSGTYRFCSNYTPPRSEKTAKPAAGGKRIAVR